VHNLSGELHFCNEECEPIRRGNVIYGEERLSHFAVKTLTEDLTNLFKSYVRSLVSEIEVELKKGLLAYQSHDLIRRGINDFKEEMLRRI